MKKIPWFLAAVTLAASGSYIFVYLYRWEWHRALLVGILFLAAEVGFTGALVLKRLGELRQEDSPTTPDPRLLRRIQEARPPSRRFEWLKSTDQVSVFLPILLGSGAVISGLAWLVEKVASATTEPHLESALAADLSGLRFPQKPLVATDTEVLTQQGSETARLLLGPGNSA